MAGQEPRAGLYSWHEDRHDADGANPDWNKWIHCKLELAQNGVAAFFCETYADDSFGCTNEKLAAYGIWEMDQADRLIFTQWRAGRGGRGMPAVPDKMRVVSNGLVAENGQGIFMFQRELRSGDASEPCAACGEVGGGLCKTLDTRVGTRCEECGFYFPNGVHPRAACYIAEGKPVKVAGKDIVDRCNNKLEIIFSTVEGEELTRVFGEAWDPAESLHEKLSTSLGAQGLTIRLPCGGDLKNEPSPKAASGSPQFPVWRALGLPDRYDPNWISDELEARFKAAQMPDSEVSRIRARIIVGSDTEQFWMDRLPPVKKIDVVLTCEHLANGHVVCTNVGGEEVLNLCVPADQDPYGSWLWQSIEATASKEGTRLKLVTTDGRIIWTQGKVDIQKCLPGCMNPEKGLHHKKCPNYESRKVVGASICGIAQQATS